MARSTGYTPSRAVPDPVGRAGPRARRLPARPRRAHAGDAFLRPHALARAAAEALRGAERGRPRRRRLATGARRADGPGPERPWRGDRRARAHGPPRAPTR